MLRAMPPLPVFRQSL